MNVSQIDAALLKGLLSHGNAEKLKWTVQGFGMVRTYLDDNQRFRLNIWDHRLRTPGVSLIHDHPWSFTSKIYCGGIRNKRYEINSHPDAKPTHWFKHIKTGPEAVDISEPTMCTLMQRGLIENYSAGSTYAQHLQEIHETDAERGTVTINDRTEPTEAYSARVFWHVNGNPWMAARPRPAAQWEWMNAVLAARELL